MSISLPDRIKDFEAKHFNALLDVILPVQGKRLDASFDIEIETEIETEGDTYVMHYRDGHASFEQGFADEDPFIAMTFDESFYAFVQPFVQKVLEGELNASLTEQLRKISVKDARTSFDALTALDGLKAELQVKGVGHFALSRGPIDEAIDEMKFSLQRSDLEAVFKGDFKALAKMRPQKGMTLLPKLLGAMGPVVNAFKTIA